MKRIWLKLSVAVAALTFAGVATAATPRDKVRAWRMAHEREILADFTRFVAIPDVASNVADVEKNAAYISAQLEMRGFKTQLLRAAPGTPPAVFAERMTPGAKRTVLYYAHYDGQPISQTTWVTPPFTPTLRLPDGSPGAVPTSGPLNPELRLFARGTGDDRASVQAMFSALDALKADGIKPSVNIKLIYEGEEEQGSPHFGTIVAQNAALLKADLLIKGDGPTHQSGKQEINGGNRGGTGFTATVYGPNRALHDGHYGNWAPSPAVMIAELIVSLRDDDGHILIPHFYDDVAPITAADRAALATVPPVEEALKKELGLGRSIGPARLGEGVLMPAVVVRAIHVGDAGPSPSAAIATEATANIGFRLAPGETPAHVKELTERYLTSQGWFIVHATPDMATRIAHPKVLKLMWGGNGSIAIKTPFDDPAAAAIATSIEHTVGYPVIKEAIVGASSDWAELVGALNVPNVGVSIANPDDNQHAANENLRLGNLWDGIEIYAGLLADLNW